MRTRVILFSLIMLLPAAADAATAPKNFKELAELVVTLLSSGIALMVTLGLVIYLWGIASNMTKLAEGHAESDAWKAYVFWGIIILFVMVSIGGILNLLRNSIFSGDMGGTPMNGDNKDTPTFIDTTPSI